MTRLATVCSVLLAAVGCTTVRSVEPGSVPVLAGNEGLLVIDLQTELPIRKLSIDRATAVSDLGEGEHFVLLVVSAGRHHWSGIVIPAGEGEVAFRMSAEEWAFRVEAGRLNYPDQLVVEGDVGKSRVEIGGGRRNRSALALRKLQERFPELLSRYPPVYGGPGPDSFLEYYAETFLKPRVTMRKPPHDETRPHPRVVDSGAAAAARPRARPRLPFPGAALPQGGASTAQSQSVR